MTAALSNVERALHHVTPDVGAKSRSYEMAIPVPDVTVGKEAAPSFRQRVLAAHRIIPVALSLRENPIKLSTSCSRRRKMSLSRRPTREVR